MESFKIKGEYIHLNQLLKVIGWCENGADANINIENGLVRVNDAPEFRKRNKIMPGMVVSLNGNSVIIE